MFNGTLSQVRFDANSRFVPKLIKIVNHSHHTIKFMWFHLLMTGELSMKFICIQCHYNGRSSEVLYSSPRYFLLVGWDISVEILETLWWHTWIIFNKDPFVWGSGPTSSVLRETILFVFTDPWNLTETDLNSQTYLVVVVVWCVDEQVGFSLGFWTVNKKCNSWHVFIVLRLNTPRYSKFLWGTVKRSVY